MNDDSAPADLVIRARWVIPLPISGELLADHAVVVRDGRIEALLPGEESTAIASRERIDLSEHVLLPGLVNAHGHAAMALLRGYADDLSLMPWLEQHIWPAEQAHVSAEFVRDGAALAIVEMLLSGTTTFSDQYFFPEAVADLATEVGIRCQLAAPIFDFPTAYGSGSDDYLSKALALHDVCRGRDRISVALGPHAPYTVSQDALSRIATYAAELDLAIQIHLHETRGEVLSHVEAHGERPIDTLDRLGLLGPRTQCVHMTDLGRQDIDRLVSTGAHVVHCPQSNMKLASGACPVPTLLEAGVNLGLGTDGAASNNNLNLFDEMHSAALLAKHEAADPRALSASETLHLATLGGAAALGLDNRIGSLEVGKDADMIAVDLAGAATQPVYNPLSQLVYACNGSEVSHSWVAGEALVRDRRLVSIDAAEVLTRARHWAHRIKA
ncbi:MAG: TRZ/ATZ family hydrolase [Halieaceae bacterium]|jgi:5-methylthioadenosine/S-adenosylhomocysteine deaminase|nr:TRZ/ATZ family hydrolase [Halieaceae bacterium]